MASEKTVSTLKTLSLAVPPDVAEKVQEAAKAERRSVSNWLLGLVLKALEDDYQR